MKRQTKKDGFLKSLIFISLLMVGVNVLYAFLSGTLNKLMLIASVFLMILTYRRWLIDYDINLIKEYTLLMEPLGKLSSVNSDTNKIILKVITDPKNVSNFHCWQRYYELKSENVDRTFNKFNTELSKVLSIRYYLFWLLFYDPVPLIRDKFFEVVFDTEILYIDFIEMLIREKIPTNEFDYDLINDTYKQFITALEKSRDNFIEIKKDIPDKFLSPLPFNLPTYRV